MAGKVGVKTRSTSRFTGVTLFAAQNKYQAFVKIDGKRIHLGMWRSERDAAIARDRAVLHHRLDRSLNLPRIGRRRGPASPEDLVYEARVTEKKQQSTSRYFGVAWDARRSRWAAIICVGERRSVQIAQYDDETDAALAYDRVVRHLLGPKALLNFPKKRLKPMTLADARNAARRLLKKRTTSTYRGVCWNLRRQMWVAQVNHPSHQRNIGFFHVEEDAARAYDKVAKRIWRARATLNFG